MFGVTVKIDSVATQGLTPEQAIEMEKKMKNPKADPGSHGGPFC